jgi:hypothetical protein
MASLLTTCFVQVLSRDSVTVSVDAVVYYRVRQRLQITKN